ncbi:MAG TPA: DNA mismatch repair protein MutS, partial [Spirochaetales bacterium]|nr:DNA mismatch repair protein MutS [Spirochaetales bacterium]
MAEQLPLLTQYERIKAQHRNEILFFRLGDFYEMFFQDAIEASAILNLTLTKRQDAPMCGV